MSIKQQTKKSPFFPFLLLIIAVIGITLVQHNTSISNEMAKEGFISPDFTLADVAGNDLTLSKYRGKVIFINFWATWCPTCDEEMASMEKLYQRMKGKNFEMLTISRDETTKVVIDYIKKNNLTFPVLMDSKNTIGRLYNTTGVPETFILNKAGIIVGKVIGPRNWGEEEMIGSFEKLAAEEYAVNNTAS